MTMACTVLFSPSFTPQTSINPIKHLNSIHPSRPSNLCHYGNKKDFTLLALASSSYTPINVDYLEREFSGHGVSFAEIGDSCVVRMGLENGSIASLMLPSGLITSYKAPMWHGGMLEVLHTSVSKGEENIGAIVQGGISVCFKCGNDDGVSWSPSIWALHDVSGSPQKFIQVELISRDSEDMVEVKYIVTLQSDVLSSELVFSNLKPSTLQLMGSFISHLTVSTPDATYAVGLEGSNYFSRPPFMSDFSIIPPVFGQKNATGSIQSWGQTTLKGLLSNWGVRGQEDATESKQEEEIEGEENNNYAQLTEKMSRIYTSAPRSFTVIDRGRRNSVVVGREGLDEIYMFSPGSNHEWYSKYAYVCVGPSAMLKPIILGPGGTWRGMQYLHNPNL